MKSPARASATHGATREDERESTVTFEIGPRPGGNTWFRLTHSPARPVRAANGNSPPLALAA